ncbi:MAG: Maf family protein [Candidatus Hydrothermia bacterium]
MNNKLILASTSPRRRFILQKFGYDFDVIPPKGINEEPKEIQDALKLAEEKARSLDIANRVILACDTIVVIKDKILGKPKNYHEAKTFLKMLSGRWHEVYTGYAILAGSLEKKKLVKTRVKFKRLDDEEMEILIQYGNAFDKAGAYGIQGIAGLFIEKIEGSYYNVVGIPIEYIYEDLKILGITPKWENIGKIEEFF